MYRYSDKYGKECEQTGRRNTPSLYYQYGADVRRPGTFINESNDLAGHSGELEQFDDELPDHLRYLDDYLVRDEQDGSLWYAPDLSDESELYEAAQEDALREEEGLAPEEFVMPDGRTVTGKLNVAVECLRHDHTLVKPQQAEAVRRVVQTRIAQEKAILAENKRRLPAQLREGYMSKVGVDLPSWWTRYDWKNLFKKELPQWGKQETEWDAPFRPLSAADKHQIEHGQVSVAEALYGEHNMSVGGAEELVRCANRALHPPESALYYPKRALYCRQRDTLTLADAFAVSALPTSTQRPGQPLSSGRWKPTTHASRKWSGSWGCRGVLRAMRGARWPLTATDTASSDPTSETPW